MIESNDNLDLLELAADVVAAYVSNNTITATELPALIGDVFTAIQKIANGGSAVAEVESEPQKPAVSVKKSITDDYIICLEDGKKFKSLKRHLRTHYNLTPEQYREKWGLQSDYPMVAPNYASARSNLAKKMGLGQQRKKKAA